MKTHCTVQPHGYVRENGQEWKDVRLIRSAYDTLKKWASVARTLNESKNLLDELGSMAVNITSDDEQLADRINANLDELDAILHALDQCNESCKRQAFQDVDAEKMWEKDRNGNK